MQAAPPVWVACSPPVRSIFIQYKTTRDIVENKIVKIRFFSENNILKSKTGMNQKPVGSHAAYLVHLFDKGTLKPKCLRLNGTVRDGAKLSPHRRTSGPIPLSGLKKEG